MTTRSSQTIVLGAGMVGTGAALALQNRGYEVVLVDRAAPGGETSYGNAGVIQGEACVPYALPRGLPSLWRIACKRDNGVEWDVRGLWRAAPSLLPYWFHSAPHRHRQISETYSALIRRATQDHAPLIAASDTEAMIRRDGYRLLFHKTASFDLMSRKAEQWKIDYGVRFATEDSDALAAAEPALKQRLTGALHWQDAWTCSDPGGLVKAYAALFQRRGGELVEAEAVSIEPLSSGWRVHTRTGMIDAEHLVVALGPWAPQMLRPLGYYIPMIYKRGYHMHFTNTGQRTGLTLIDTKSSAVYARMRAGLRIATGVDLSTERNEAMPKQLRRACASASELLDFGEQVETSAWRGIRPCMPDMLPVVGPAPRHRGLWFDFGHGHQGFTLGPTTGELLASLIADEPDPITLPLSPSRPALDL